MPAVFISYRRADSASAAGRIDDQLVARFGRATVFKDVDSIPPGVDFARYIEDAIQQSAVALVIIGPRWLTASVGPFQRRLDDPADFVRIEIETAARLGVLIIPLLVDGATMPSAARLPTSLRLLASLNALPVRPDPDFHRDMGRVTVAVERLMNGPPPTPPTPPEPAPTKATVLTEATEPLTISQRRDDPAFFEGETPEPQEETHKRPTIAFTKLMGAKLSHRRAPGTLVATISALALIAVVAVLLLSNQLSALFANPTAIATASSSTATAQSAARTFTSDQATKTFQLTHPYMPDGVGPCDRADQHYSSDSPLYWNWSNVTCVANVARITDRGTLDFYGRRYDFPPAFKATFTLSFHSPGAGSSCVNVNVFAGDRGSPGAGFCDNGSWSSYWPTFGSQYNKCCIQTAGTLTFLVTVNIRTVTISVNGQTLLSPKDDAGSIFRITLQGYNRASGAWIGVSSFTLKPITT